MEYSTDVDEFLDTIYQAGMDVERDLASEKERVEAISRSNQYLRLIDEAVDLMKVSSARRNDTGCVPTAICL